MSDKRKLRLKALLDRGDEIRSSFMHQDMKETLQQIQDIVTASNTIIDEGTVQDRRENTTEVAMDAQVVKMNHELVCKVFEKTSQFSEQLYIEGLEQLCKNDQDEWNWSILTALVVPIAFTCRAKSTMYGAVENIAMPPKAAYKRQTRNNDTQQEEPETVNNLDRRDKGAEKINEVHKQVAMLFQVNNVETLPWYLLIIDPHNFMNTVENAFQLSFLVRDNKLGIHTGADGHPEVYLIKSNATQTEHATKQNALTLNMEICQSMIEFYNITEPLLVLS